MSGREPAAADPDDARCVTCGDVAVEARIVALERGNAVVERSGLREGVAVDLVAGLSVGDVVLCHAGVALEKLDRPPGGVEGEGR